MTENIRPNRRNQDEGNPPVKGGGKRKNRDSRRELRREEALMRQEACDARSASERLASLVERGHGHCREAQILLELAAV